MLAVSVVSQKGGAGKSTLALHLAAEGATRGLSVLLVDLDPQGNVSSWGDRRGERLPDVSAESPANLDRVLQVARTNGYGLIVLDTAPHADQAALRAIRSADLVLVPCRPATFDLEAISITLDLCLVAKRASRVVLNAAPIRSRVVEEARRAIAEMGGSISPAVVRHRVAYQHCVIDGRTASEFEPGGPASREIAALYDDMMACMGADTIGSMT